MVKVRVRPETNCLYLDFSYRGKRCKEQTALADTPTNRRMVESMAKRIQRATTLGIPQAELRMVLQRGLRKPAGFGFLPREFAPQCTFSGTQRPSQAQFAQAFAHARSSR